MPPRSSAFRRLVLSTAVLLAARSLGGTISAEHGVGRVKRAGALRYVRVVRGTSHKRTKPPVMKENQ